MNRGNPYRLAWLSAFLLGWAGLSHGEVLFDEEWDAGGIDSSKWTVAGNNPEEFRMGLVDVGGGDRALLMGNAFLNWSTRIRSVEGWPRGENLRVTFKVWGDSSLPDFNQIFPGGGGFTGPWHDTSDTGQALWATIDEGVDGWWNRLSWEESGQSSGIQMDNPELEAVLHSAFAAATSKQTALHLRVWAGDDRGGRLEWSVDGINFSLARDSANRPLDTRGNLQGPSGIETGSASPLYLGFSPAQSAVLIDDIVVETGADTPPTPTPTATPEPIVDLPDDIRELTQHFDDPGAGLGQWIFVPESNVEQVNTTLHPGLAMIFEAGRGQDVKGVLNQPIPINHYALPWEFQLNVQQAFNVLTGRSTGQLNTAIGLNVALTFSDPSIWPEDRAQQPPNTHSFQLFNVHLGNFAEVGSGLPQLVDNPNIFRMQQDRTPETYFVYGRGDLGQGQPGSGPWDVPYIWIGDGAKYAGPAASQIYLRCKILNRSQIQISIKFDASHGWNTRTLNVGQFGQITGIWEIGPIISADRWIPDTLAPALAIPNTPSPVATPNPDFEYYVDYCVFRQSVPIPFEHFSDDFNVLGWMGQWQIQEENTLVETYSNPGYLTMTLLGSGLATGFGPVDAAPFDLNFYPPPWEKEVCFIAPDDTAPWNFYLALVARGSDFNNFVIFLPGVRNIPGVGHRFMSGLGGSSPFHPSFPGGVVPEEILASKPLYMLFQMVDRDHLRVGFRGDPDDPWFFSDVYDVRPAMPGGGIEWWQLGVWSTSTSVLGGGAGGPAYQKFMVDYVDYRFGLTEPESAIPAGRWEVLD